MSYTRTYEGSIEVSGSISYSYPASEYGGSGTVSYHDTVPVIMNVFVDTEPFDASVVRTKSSVDVLTGAVVGMEAAQCKAIKDNADKIAQSLIDGFYGVVNSEMSVTMAENNSELQSKFALMMEFSKDIISKHNRMQEDLERLQAHFGAIFKSMDDDLCKRIKTLDKPAFRLSDEIRNELILKPYLSQGAANMEQLAEDNGSVNLIKTARLRKRTSKVLALMENYTRKIIDYKNTISDMVMDNAGDEAGYEYIPAVYCQNSNIQGDGSYTIQYYLPEMKDRDKITASTHEYVSSVPGDRWAYVPAGEMNLIDQAFSNLVEQSMLSQGVTDAYNGRVYKEMLELWQKNKPTIMSIQKNN